MYECNDSGDPLRYYVHGVSYIDERLAMVNCYETTSTSDDRPYYYVLDRMYHVRALVDRAGSIVERYCYDRYGKPLIRKSLGRGDQRGQDTILALGDGVDFAATTATPPTMWDPRADMDDDGDIDATDVTLKNAKAANWPNPGSQPTVSQAFSDVGNRYMFQGVPHFAIDTSSSDTTVKFPLNHHRARFAEPVTGRWITRDPYIYQTSHFAVYIRPRTSGCIRASSTTSSNARKTDLMNSRFIYQYIESSSLNRIDPTGLKPPSTTAPVRGGVVDCCAQKILDRIAELASYGDAFNWCEAGTGVSNILGDCDLTDFFPSVDSDTNNDGRIDECVTEEHQYQNPEIYIIWHNPNIWPQQPPHLPTPEEIQMICGASGSSSSGGIITDGASITSISCPYSGPVGQ